LETCISEADSRAEAATKAPGGCLPSMFCLPGGFLMNSFVPRLGLYFNMFEIEQLAFLCER
jgi:hypothetical protein